MGYRVWHSLNVHIGKPVKTTQALTAVQCMKKYGLGSQLGENSGRELKNENKKSLNNKQMGDSLANCKK